MKVPRTTGYAELYWYCPTCKKEIPEAEIRLEPHGFQPFAEAGSYLPPLTVHSVCGDMPLLVGHPIPQDKDISQEELDQKAADAEARDYFRS